MKEKKYEEVYAELEALIARIEDPERDLASIGGAVTMCAAARKKPKN